MPYFETIKDILSHGATQESINNEDLKSINIPLPSKEKLELFHNVTKNIHKQISDIKLMNNKLINLKNYMLPLLINGQLQ